MAEAYFSVRAHGPVVVAAVRSDLFDEMPDLGGGGPANAELVAGLHAAVAREPVV